MAASRRRRPDRSEEDQFPSCQATKIRRRGEDLFPHAIRWAIDGPDGVVTFRRCEAIDRQG